MTPTTRGLSGIRLKIILMSFVWFSLATFVAIDNYNVIKFEREFNKNFAVTGEWIGVVSRYNPLLVIPFCFAGVVTLFGGRRIVLVVGIPAMLYVVYLIGGAHERAEYFEFASKPLPPLANDRAR